MNITKLSVAAMIISVAGVPMAADAVSIGKTREQVRAELAQARARGEYDALTMLYIDPSPVDKRAAYTLAQAPVSATGDVQRTAAAATAPKTRAEVKEELARAKASGDYDRMLMWYVDPAPVDPRMAWPGK